jgi:MoxR-like ATPase
MATANKAPKPESVVALTATDPCGLGPQGPTLAEAFGRIAEFVRQMIAAYPEREQVIRGLIRALIARLHAFIGGPPGTAKSAMCRAFADAVADGSYFETLLTRFTTPEEVFGPISYTALRNDQYRRITAGYAPRARVVFYDEVWKASSTILNCNLTMMNERVFHNGGQPEPVDLDILIGASNEYPQSDELNALYDRFTVRFWVDYLGQPDNLARVLRQRGPGKVTMKLLPGDLDVLRDAAATLPFTDANIRTLLAIKAACEQNGYITSDRKWIACASLVAASAVVAGRTTILPSDFGVLADVLWREHKDRAALATIIGQCADPWGARAEAIVDGVRTAMADLPSMDLFKTGQKNRVSMLKEISAVSGKVMAEIDKVMEALEGAPENPSLLEAREVASKAKAQIDEMSNTLAWAREAKRVQ